MSESLETVRRRCMPLLIGLGSLSPLIDWTRQMAGFWQNRFDDLEDLLKRMDQ